MFGSKKNRKSLEREALIAAIDRSQAVIEFDLVGIIITANKNFLDVMGYTLAEVQGKHHSMFIDEAYRDSQEYQAFWELLRAGTFHTAEYKRLAKGGRHVWIQASYNPIMDASGKPVKVIKFATDVTQQKQTNSNYEAQINAIGKSQAVIEFNLDGTIITANANFLSVMGYSLEEIQGKHHRMFVTKEYSSSHDYLRFWTLLNEGRHHAGEYQRIGKGGRQVWIQASYNPTFDLDGKLIKIVKFATELTQQVVTRDNVRALLQTIAIGSEKLNTSVKEIAQAMMKSKATADIAADQVAFADGSTKQLSQVAKSMNEIVNTISKISSQINLLSLNASIESARAGQAGRGFGVVATEVKALAGQANKATELIAKEINTMQMVFAEVTNGLEQIKSSIGNVREYVTATAAAVEEQSVVVNEMSSTAQQAATQSRDLA